MEEQSLEKKPTLNHKPEFDGGSFVIECLSTSPNGFEIKTDKTGRRREAGVPIPLDQNQRNKLKVAMIDQMRFAEGNKAKAALDNLRQAQTNKRKIIAAEDFENKRQTYKERAVPTIGLRNIRVEGNVITVDIKPVDFPAYREFSKTNASSELLDFATASATSMVLITHDNRLILQHRSARNKMYGGVPGASVAGFLKGGFDPQKESAFLPIDTDFVKSDSAREANEELGLDREDFSILTIAGITHEKNQIHDEFMIFGKTRLTADEMRKKAIKTSRNRKLSEEEFEEKFVDIDASPDAIKILLTKVKCPIPPTHAAIFIAAGYCMMLETSGIQKANEWKDNLQSATRSNYKEIDHIVKDYYDKNPNAFEEIPERYKNSNIPNRNRNGYDPEFLPEEQGLPDLISELKRVKLIPDKENETMKSVDHMIILDVDGVITDPKEKIITEPEILDQIVSRLEKGEPVALNTGRSIEWVIDRVLNPLTGKVKDKKMLQNLIVVGEKGGTWAEFDDQGNLTKHKDENISVPDDLKKRVRDLISKNYPDSMFFDETKETMISTEMKDGYSLKDYREKQNALLPELQRLLSDDNLNYIFKVDPTTIAVDVENKFVGKHFAVRRILEWIKNKGINPKQYIALGDSFRSDISMAEEINSQKLPVEFVYVGEGDMDTSKYPFTIHSTRAKFGKGALEFLSTIPSA